MERGDRVVVYSEASAAVNGGDMVGCKVDRRGVVSAIIYILTVFCWIVRICGQYGIKREKKTC